MGASNTARVYGMGKPHILVYNLGPGRIMVHSLVRTQFFSRLMIRNAGHGATLGEALRSLRRDWVWERGPK